jgi:hypothetical protein
MQLTAPPPAHLVLPPTRRDQIAEALGDLEELFFAPGSFGDCSLSDAATSLASEFDCGPLRDDEIVGRLDKMVAAEMLGDLRAARRHLMFVRRKLLERFGAAPTHSVPVVRDADAARLASAAAKAQVVERPIDAGAGYDRAQGADQ